MTGALFYYILFAIYKFYHNGSTWHCDCIYLKKHDARYIHVSTTPRPKYIAFITGRGRDIDSLYGRKPKLDTAVDRAIVSFTVHGSKYSTNETGLPLVDIGPGSVNLCYTPYRYIGELGAQPNETNQGELPKQKSFGDEMTLDKGYNHKLKSTQKRPKIRIKGTEMKDQAKQLEQFYEDTMALAESTSEEDREKYQFVRESIDEMYTKVPNRLPGETRGLTHDEIIESLNEPQKETEDPSSPQELLGIYLKLIKAGLHEVAPLFGAQSNMDEMKVTEKCLKALKKEESCGYKYPITGTPDELYNDPNVYKSWGRTPLYHTQHMGAPSTTKGLVQDVPSTIEDRILSSDKQKDAHELESRLESIRVDRLLSNIDGVTSEVTSDIKSVVLNIDMSNNQWELELKSKDRQRQLEMLLALNPYNPWDKYKQMKKAESSIKDTLEIKYNISGNNVKLGYVVPGDQESLNKIQSQTVDHTEFIKGYLHYYLMLPEDIQTLEYLNKAECLEDVLKLFDIFDKIDREPQPEITGIFDRFMMFLFPNSQGFPKFDKDAQFPRSMDNMGSLKHRFNILNAVVALVRSQKLIKTYASDIFKEQRMKKMLETIEHGLELEIQRLKLGITDISIGTHRMCHVDDVLLATVSAALSAWNVRNGIQGIVDAIIVLTLKLMTEMRPKYLIATAINLEYIHTLPRKVFYKFIQTVAAHIERMVDIDLGNIAVKPESKPWMDFETAARTLSLLAQHPQCLNKVFMNKFMQIYKRDYLKLKIPKPGQVQVSPTFPHGYQNILHYEPGRMLEQLTQEGKIAASPEDSGNTAEEPIHPELIYNLRQPWRDPFLNKANIKTIETHCKQSDVDTDKWEYGRTTEEMDDEEDLISMQWEDLMYLKMDRQMKIQAVRSRYHHYITSLMKCLSWCDMTMEYQDLVKKLQIAVPQFKPHSATAMAVLRTIRPKTEIEHEMLLQAYDSIIQAKWDLKAEQWLDIMEVYKEATSGNDREARLQINQGFISRMYDQFVTMKSPKPRILKQAVTLLKHFNTGLNKKQLCHIFQQIFHDITDYSYIQIQGLNAEALDYPLETLTFVLTVAAELGVRHDETWEVYLKLLNIFKHTLSLEDINDILLAIKMAKYTGVKNVGNMLMMRACNAIEVIPNLCHRVLIDIMQNALSIKVTPIKLLRWYLYLQLYDIPQSDMDRLSMDIVSDNPKYEVDFRGWKLPRRVMNQDATQDSEIVPVSINENEAIVPPDELKYRMKCIYKGPGPYTGNMKIKVDATLPEDIVESLKEIVGKVINEYQTTPEDIRLFKLAGLMQQNNHIIAKQTDYIE
ncbi:hypothetical protein BBOV_III003400 [Babesia bovis T2Bo]|uniref:Uncharacterized protein n=1 Tax=Babesia bovis TaxID=5865 RepID=A7AMX0_BABBO|nr:hypothetical protein BBOV_III003400 [Babesia bovis T2Bo]EDO07904.1 hypothetical protein BBOV_III003400 [Babesia bovis T2Bo]|eukprot:XP_001611472.1 hypothetical protein [Babesia bovis T2Bo]